MVRIGNQIVCVVLITLGLIFIVGILSGRGELMVLASYFGLFLVVYAFVVYVGTSIYHLVKPMKDFLGGLAPINFGLGLLAVASFQIVPFAVSIVLVSVIILAAICAFSLLHLKFRDSRFLPLVPLVVSGSSLLIEDYQTGTLLQIFAAMFLISSSIFIYLSRIRSTSD